MYHLLWIFPVSFAGIVFHGRPHLYRSALHVWTPLPSFCDALLATAAKENSAERQDSEVIATNCFE